jgi:hypothetical protein
MRGTAKELLEKGVRINGKLIDSQPELGVFLKQFGKKIGEVKPDVPRGQRGGRRPATIWEIPDGEVKFTFS